jgi:protein-S-isoprenylcysteine O-methyltransferase Ste14
VAGASIGDKIAAVVFKHRRFVTITIFVIPMLLKLYLRGTTSLLSLLAGIIIVAIGMAFRGYSAGHLWGKHTVTEIESDFLRTSGPFAYIRNPLYVGNFVVGIGLCVALNEWYAYVIFVTGYVFLYSIVIPYEESFLEQEFGEAYLEYKKHTNRFLPRFRSYKGGTKIAPNYKLGLASEKYYILILAIAFILFYFLFVE